MSQGDGSMEDSSRSSEDRYKVVSELMFDYAYAYNVAADGSYHLEWITESFMRMTGYSADDNYQSFVLYHPDDARSVQHDVEETIHGKSTRGEYRIITKNGEVRWVDLFRRPVWDDSLARVVRFYGVAQDITERKRTEAALRESEERYRIVSELISDYAYSYDIAEDGSIHHEWTTESFAKLTGYTPNELGDGFELYHPDDQQSAADDTLKTINGEPTRGEYRIFTRSGEMRWIEIYRRPVWDEAQRRVVRFYGVARDITERKRLIDEQLARSAEHQRVKVLTDFIHGFSHDFRTPLATIKTTSYLLRKTMDAPQHHQRLDTLDQQTTHLERLLSQFLIMSRLDSTPDLVLTSLELNSLVEVVCSKMRPQAERWGLAIQMSLSQPMHIMVDVHEAERAVVSLLENALQYTAPEGEIKIRTYRQDNFAVVEVADTGVGIHADDLPHIFEWFYRADKARTTTGRAGLGLSIAHKIAELHGGQMEVESQPGQGSTFRLMLPLANG